MAPVGEAERPREMRAEPDICPNCGASADGAFCAVCGQSQDVDPKSLRAWIRGFLEETLALDGRLWNTLKALLLRPGSLSREWEAGRRARWTHPLRLYLLSSFVFVAMTLITSDTSVVQVSTTSEAVAVAGQEVAADLQQDRLVEAVRANYAYLMFVLVPLFALWLKLLFRSSGVVYVGHLVHALHIHAAFFLLAGISVPMEDLPNPWDYVAQTPFVVWMLLYPIPSTKYAYGVSWLGAVIKTSVVSTVHLLLLSVGFLVVALVTGTFDAQQAVGDAHETYWDARSTLARGDSARGAEGLSDAIAEYLRLEYVWYDDHVLAHLADALLRTGDVTRARTEASRALAQEPGSVVALGVAARAAALDGDSIAATRLWERYLEAYPVPDSLEAVGGNHTTDLIRDERAARAWVGSRPPRPAR